MRVIAGTARGRRLVAPAGFAVRPTSDRVRQATFNALDSRDAIRDAVVVDLFAGSGALGIEALSRGAQRCTFVESDRKAADCIRDNLANVGLAERGTVVRSDALHWARGSLSAGTRVDLLLVDPPYKFEQWTELLAAVRPALVRPVGEEDQRGLAVLETGTVLEPGEGWEVVRQQRYGGTVITLAVPTDDPSPQSARWDPPKE